MIREIRPLDYLAYRKLRALAYRESPLSFADALPLSGTSSIDHSLRKDRSSTTQSLHHIIKQSYQLPHHLIAGWFDQQQLMGCCTIRPAHTHPQTYDSIMNDSNNRSLIMNSPSDSLSAAPNSRMADDTPKRSAELGGLYVSPAIRQHGAASALLEHCIEHCLTHQYQSIELSVHAENHIAIHLYETYGFKRVRSASNAAPSLLHKMQRAL